jgi:PAS domain S-box-containing protein
MKPNHQFKLKDFTHYKANFKRTEMTKRGSNSYPIEQAYFLKKNRAKLEPLATLYESIPCISFTLNSEGIILAISQFGAAYLGYEPPELTQKSIDSIFYFEDQSNCQSKFTSLQQLTQLSEWEARLIHKNGEIKRVRARVRLVQESLLNPIILLVCENMDCSNLTYHKRTETVLRENEEPYRAVVEQSADGIYLIDAVTRQILDANSTYLNLLGYTLEEILQLTLYDIVLIDREVLDAKIEKALREKQIYLPESQHRCKDGSLVDVSASVSLISYRGRQVFCVTVRDITERKQAAAALQESSSRLRLAFEAAEMGTWDWNILTDQVVYCDQLGPVFGLPRGSGCPTYKAFLNCVYPEDRESVACAITRAIEEGVDYTIEFRVVWPDGTVRWVGNKGQVYFDESGKPIRMIGVAMDITARKQAEDVLQQQFLKERLVGAIAQRIHHSLNLEEILNTTVQEVRQFLACDRAIIFRLHGDGSGIVVVESVGSGWNRISGTIINDRYFAESYVRLYQQGRVQAVEDIYAAGLTPCHVDALAQFQVRANLVVPIVQEEKLWGLLVAQQCSQTRQWQPLEIDLLKSLATQAAIAILQSTLFEQAQTEIVQRKQAEAALQQQFQRERLVSAITGRIRQSLNLEEILNATAAEVRQVLQTDRVIIFRFDPDWSGKVVVESVDDHCQPILGKDIYDPCFKHAYILPYQQGRVKAIEDIYTANLNQCHIDLLSQFQVRANLVVPILQSEQIIHNPNSETQNRLWGLLIAHHCSSPRQWQQFEIDLLSSLASQAAIAIQQSQLYEQAKSQAKREQALNQLTQAIRRSLDLQTIFGTATQEIEKLLKVDRTQIVQYLPEQKLWVNVAESCKCRCSSVSLGMEISDENNPIADRLKRSEVVRVDDTNSFEDKTNQNVAQQFPGAWLLVPLRSGSSVWGALGLVMNTGPYHWQDSEVELICEVADQLAIALQQAQLYEQSRTATATALTQAQKLEQTLQKLQKTQAQLVQSEKMSSLGQLVAGVAHEINNPVSFIYGNLIHADEYTQDILGLLKLYQQQYPNPTSEIESEIETIDLDFLIEDLPRLLDSMKVGAERICEIVGALRNFSRLAEAEMKAVDLHEGLDSTLMILHNRLKASGKHPEIQVIKEYGNLPKVECYAGQLNQVFMNLLTNAIDALDEQNQRRISSGDASLTTQEIQANPSLIRVRTEVRDNNQIAISITDNGPGMTEQVKARLFDPFFTTKPVGAGTGLGLSISYQIVVEKHGGQLLCFSELGKGTEFVIQIPLLQQVHDPIFL